MANLQFKPIPVDFAIDLYTGLLSARRTKLQPALAVAVRDVGIRQVDHELDRLVPAKALTHVASLGLRGERVFPVPAILRHTPTLIGYYRMLLGISLKEFGQPRRLGYAPWVNAESTGRLSPLLDQALDDFCQHMIAPLAQLVSAMDQFDDRDLSDMALLTLGPTLQGGRNNAIGSRAAQGILVALRVIIEPLTTFDSTRLIRFQSKSGRVFELVAGSDPDIALNIGVGTLTEPLLAVEVKGGRDLSNAYNRAGEAEKSHITAKIQGYQHRWTLIHMDGVDRNKVLQKSPSSTEVFEAADILSRYGPDWERFQLAFQELIQ